MSDQLSAELLLHTIEEIERLNGEADNIREDKKFAFAHARENGFKPKVIRQIAETVTAYRPFIFPASA